MQRPGREWQGEKNVCRYIRGRTGLLRGRVSTQKSREIGERTVETETETPTLVNLRFQDFWASEFSSGHRSEFTDGACPFRAKLGAKSDKVALSEKIIEISEVCFRRQPKILK